MAQLDGFVGHDVVVLVRPLCPADERFLVVVTSADVEPRAWVGERSHLKARVEERLHEVREVEVPRGECREERPAHDVDAHAHGQRRLGLLLVRDQARRFARLRMQDAVVDDVSTLVSCDRHEVPGGAVERDELSKSRSVRRSPFMTRRIRRPGRRRAEAAHGAERGVLVDVAEASASGRPLKIASIRCAK